jgi:hypothetical protein
VVISLKRDSRLALGSLPSRSLPHRATFSILDSTFTLHSVDARVVAAVRACFSFFEVSDGSGLSWDIVIDQADDRLRVSVEDLVLGCWQWPQAIEAVIGAMTRGALSNTSADVILHAGAVVREGEAFLISGASGSGKSTIISALLRDGFEYLTDEAVLLNIDPLVARGLGRNIGLIDRGRLGSRKRYISPSDLEAGRAIDEYPVAGVVMLRERDLSIDPSVNVLAELLSQILCQVYVSCEPSVAISAAVTLTSRVPVLQLPQGDPEDEWRAVRSLILGAQGVA